ncbi:MAG: aminodeoxychorismate/anthranilate synthase component II [Acidobacteriota bacterium]|nr:aminodeoxychorismate/anthranilate synthase component II [Acidobacteriota bacterium]
MKVLVLDNYDSFTWNLVQALEAAGGSCIVHRSDRISFAQVEALAPGRIVISPGPFGPDQSGICPEVVKAFSGRVPVLGVCLGMQVIARVMGAAVRPSGHPVHGKAARIRHDGKGLLHGLPNPFLGGSYHSLIVDPASVSEELEVSAWSEDGHIMGCRWRGRAVEGVLFHPESFLTEQGARIFENFLETPSHVV